MMTDRVECYCTLVLHKQMYFNKLNKALDTTALTARYELFADEKWANLYEACTSTKYQGR